MSITVVTARFAAQVAGGNQDLTTADLGGETPVAVWLNIVRATVDGTPANHVSVGIGAATGTSNRWTAATRAEDNVDTTDCSRRGTTDECIMVLEPTAGGVDGEADFVAFIANGVRINWGNAPAGAYFIVATFFAGDVQAYANATTLPILNNTTVINTVGFEADFVLFGTNCAAFDDASLGDAAYSVGFALNKTSVPQCCFCWFSDTGLAATSVEGQISNQYAAMQAVTGLIWGMEVSDFTGAGFSVTSRVSNPGTDQVGYLAIKFDDPSYDVAGQIITSPTGVGQQSVDIDLNPIFVMCGVTQMPLINTQYTDANAGSVGLSTFDEDDEFCNSISDEDAQGVTDNQSMSDDTAVNLPLDSGAAGHVAAFVSFDDYGWTWNFTQTQVTAKSWWALAIGFPPVPGPVAIGPRNLMYIEQITFTEPYGLQLVGGDDERLDIFLTQRGLPGL